jgi:nitroimidazol reductase NimA-like FMN-containing flavoprotein (pyridoxamine 5'-phosphate oxidase superfamily)
MTQTLVCLYHTRTMSERRALSRPEIDELLHSELVARIGCQGDGEVYVVPIVYAYDGEAFYVASVAGRKIELMRASPRVCFEVDRYDHGSWRSAIVYGRYEELEGDDVERTLDLLAARFGRKRERRVGPETVCFRIVAEQLSGRAVER